MLFAYLTPKRKRCRSESDAEANVDAEPDVDDEAEADHVGSLRRRRFGGRMKKKLEKFG